MGILESSRALGIKEIFKEESTENKNIFLRYGPRDRQHVGTLFQREGTMSNTQQNKSEFSKWRK